MAIVPLYYDADGRLTTTVTSKQVFLDTATGEVSAAPPTGGGGGSPPTASWAEGLQVGDTFVDQIILTENLQVGDTFVDQIILTENLQVGDGFSLLDAPVFAENLSIDEVFRLTVENVDVPRTATPNTDLMFDGYWNQALPATNFGNANLQAKKPVAIGGDEKQAYLTIDLTAFAGWTAAGTGLTLDLTASTSQVVGTQTLRVQAWSSANKPFVESTMTFNAQPVLDDLLLSTSIAPALAAARFSIVLPAVNLATALGKWLTFAFAVSAPADLSVDTVTIVSRDQATNRPSFTINRVERL